MKIAIMGTPVTSGNRGVLALGASLINLCSQASPGCALVLLLGNRDNQPAPFRMGGDTVLIPVVNYRLSPHSPLRQHLVWILLMSMLYRLIPATSIRASIARITPWIASVIEADFVGDVRGGDSFSDIYGMNGFLLGFLAAWTVVLVKGTMVQFPQTYGPYRHPVARRLARFLLTRSSVIIARDQESREIAKELAGPERQVLISPDVAFSLLAARPESIDVDPPSPREVPPGVIGLNVNGLMFNGGYTRSNMFGLTLSYAAFLPELIRAILAVHPGELWLIPHTYGAPGDVESDDDASLKLLRDLPPDIRRRVRLVAATYDQHEIKWIIGQCDFFIGSRMHACIAALSQGVPCVGVAYSRKFAGVFDSVGMGDWVVDARSCTLPDAVSRVVDRYLQRNGIRVELAQRADQARQRLHEVFNHLCSQASGLNGVAAVPCARHVPHHPR
ncbi:MAG: polysaccharide pyruvyl transferase family protein [Lentisphaerae bacterium]|nr:polysaccharide pyruvyl transferase family protein [Lentisphaerota bacterium]